MVCSGGRQGRGQGACGGLTGRLQGTPAVSTSTVTPCHTEGRRCPSLRVPSEQGRAQPGCRGLPRIYTELPGVGA